MSQKSIFFPRVSIIDDKLNCDFIENDLHDIEFVLPNQTTADEFQMILPKEASDIKHYYKGWWVKTANGIISKIKDYTGGNRICILEEKLITGKSKGDCILLYKKSNSVIHFDEKNKKFILGFSPNEEMLFNKDEVKNIDLSDLQVNSIDINQNIQVHNGSIKILNDSENIYTEGDVNIQKNLFIKKSIVLSDFEIDNQYADFQIEKENDVIISLKSNNSNSIQFSNNDNLFELIQISDVITLKSNDNTILTAFENGNVSLGTLKNYSILTLPQNQKITVEDNSGYLKLIGGNNDENSYITLYGKNSLHGNTIEIKAQEKIQVLTDKLQINDNIIIKNENVDIYQNVNINSNLQISKNLTVSENVYVSGKLYSDNTKIIDNIKITKNDNCNIVSIDNAYIIELNDQILLTFHISIVPLDENTCSFIELELPHKELNSSSKKDVICHFSGYSNEDELNNIYNIIGYSNPGTKNAVIRFQPNSLDVHNISVWFRYSK
jgi:hypothetical protein